MQKYALVFATMSEYKIIEIRYYEITMLYCCIS